MGYPRVAQDQQKPPEHTLKQLGATLDPLEEACTIWNYPDESWSEPGSPWLSIYHSGVTWNTLAFLGLS